jgi:protein-S-isoprenylcysteine O-methyltransferase Ste14
VTKSHHVDAVSHFWAASLTATGVVFNTAVLGRATIGISLGLIVSYIWWLRGGWQKSRARVLGPYILCLGLFCMHFAEEYWTGFYRDFPALFGIEWSAAQFVSFNAAWLVVFALSVLGVYRDRTEAYLIVIFFALTGGILNGTGHIALSLLQERYFPGSVTGVLMLASGIVLIERLAPGTATLVNIRLLAQAIMFTVLVPGTVTWWLPRAILKVDWTMRYHAGWIPVVLGAALYSWCTAQFFREGHGTPNISFAKPLAFLIGRGPRTLVSRSVYSYSRNPMYVGVLTVVFGEALLFGSWAFFFYACALCIWFHVVVLFIEEPHLRRTRGEAYLQYCRETPRWIPRPRIRLRKEESST